MGRFMAGQGLRPDLVLVSTSRRTEETWARAAPAFAGNVPAVADRRLYEATPETLLTIIRQCASDVHALMLVGHNPGLEDFARRLVAGGGKAALSRLQEKFPTAALAVIDFELEGWADVSWEKGILEHFDTPRSVA
jgi:phosphohistidine phosphatase